MFNFQARLGHPDKNPGDPKAAERFQLALASLASIDAEDENGSAHKDGRRNKIQEKMKVLQKDREEKVAVLLNNRLKPFIEGQCDEFVNWAQKEADRLSAASFGEAMLHNIGYIYARKAAKALGKESGCMRGTICSRVRERQMPSNKSQVMAASGAVSLIQIQHESMKMNQIETEEENISKAIEGKKDGCHASITLADGRCRYHFERWYVVAALLKTIR